MKSSLYTFVLAAAFSSTHTITAFMLGFWQNYQNRYKSLVVIFQSPYIDYKTMQMDVQTERSTCVPAALFIS